MQEIIINDNNQPGMKNKKVFQPNIEHLVLREKIVCGIKGHEINRLRAALKSATKQMQQLYDSDSKSFLVCIGNKAFFNFK